MSDTNGKPLPPAPFDAWAVLDLWTRRWRWVAAWTLVMAIAGGIVAGLFFATFSVLSFKNFSDIMPLLFGRMFRTCNDEFMVPFLPILSVTIPSFDLTSSTRPMASLT